MINLRLIRKNFLTAKLKIKFYVSFQYVELDEVEQSRAEQEKKENKIFPVTYAAVGRHVQFPMTR